MKRIVLIAVMVEILAGCSGARMERTSDQFGGEGPRGGVVSFTGSGDADARKLMTDYCAPETYRVTADAAQDEVVVDRPKYYFTQRRTYARFQCVNRPPPLTAAQQRFLDFATTKVAAALHSRGMTDAEFVQRSQRLRSVPASDTSQAALIRFVIEEAKNGGEIFVQISVDAPMEYLTYIAGLPPDLLHGEFLNMDKRASMGMPVYGSAVK